MTSRISPVARDEIARRLRRSRQRGEAAAALWTGAHHAEALRLAADAFATATGALPFAPRDAVTAAELSEIEATGAALSATPLPELDADVKPGHAELFSRLDRARTRIQRRLAAASLTSEEHARARLLRIGVGILAVVGLAAGAYLLLRTPPQLLARASAEYGSTFGAANVVDGLEQSEWLLPDRTPGWIDVELVPPRSVGVLRLRNAHNRHFNDRATRDYLVEVYAGGRLARTVRGRFARLEPDPPWVTHRVDVGEVDRIRVHVQSWHRDGGGLAEIEHD